MITQIEYKEKIIDISLFNVFIGYNTEVIEATKLKYRINHNTFWGSAINRLIKEDLLTERGGYNPEDLSEEDINKASELLKKFCYIHDSNYTIIKNADNSLNPYLCSPLCDLLVQISKVNNLQMILTANNPAFIDGINLEDDTQRLFYVTRKGRIRRIENKARFGDLKLSEAWLRGGYL